MLQDLQYAVFLFALFVGFAPIKHAWAEDFAHFSQTCKSVMFGLGAGEDTPKLHNDDYDFPDEIIPYGIDMFYSIYEKRLIK